MFATSGLDCFDYLVGDQHVIPFEEEGFYTERVVRVPGSYLTFEVAYPVPDVVRPPLPAAGCPDVRLPGTPIQDHDRRWWRRGRGS